MRGLFIVVEGQTEEAFINFVLSPYFNNCGIYDVRPVVVRTGKQKGGLLKYSHYRNDVMKLLFQNDMIVTSLVDYYHIPLDFPEYVAAQNKSDHVMCVKELERAIERDINHRNFIPYIQLHEFEGLLFSDSKGFDILEGLIPSESISGLKDIVNNFPNPELINEGENTHPAQRLMNLIPGYRKPFYGELIASNVGIDKMLAKCPRFNAWIQTLVQRMKS